MTRLLTAIRRIVVGQPAPVPAPVPVTLAPIYAENFDGGPNRLPRIWFDNGNAPGKVQPRFLLGDTETSIAKWSSEVARIGGIKVALFSQWPGGNPGWPEKYSDAYMLGYTERAWEVRSTMLIHGLDPSRLFIYTDIEDDHKTSIDAARFVLSGMGLGHGEAVWANFNSAVDDGWWVNSPSPDNKTMCHGTYTGDGKGDLDTAKLESTWAEAIAKGQRVVIVARYDSPRDQANLQRWRGMKGIAAVIVWKGN